MKYRLSLSIEISFTAEEFDLITETLRKSEYASEVTGGFWFENMHRRQWFNYGTLIPATMSRREIQYIEKTLGELMISDDLTKSSEQQKKGALSKDVLEKIRYIGAEASLVQNHLNQDSRSGVQEI